MSLASFLFSEFRSLGDLFEIRVLVAILKNDMKTFEKAIADVQSFYTTQKTESTNKYLMIGLHLMFLLVNDKLSDFHILIEQIDQQIQQTNPYIRTPVELEQFLMEGAYNKIFLNQKTIPSPYYTIFIQILTDTVRGDIALCIEKAYKRISVKDAIQMLFFDKESAGLQFAEKRGWKKEGNMFCFEPDMIVEGPPKAHLDTERITKQVVYYAKQLEMIV